MIKPQFIVVFCIILMWSCVSQNQFNKLTIDHRTAYLQSFLTNPRSPLDSADLDDISFFEADKEWKKKAKFEFNTTETIIRIPTYSGITKAYSIYGYFTFRHNDKSYKLQVYKNAQKPENPMYKNHLFLPFKDETNGDESYEGGRYLDLQISDINKNNTVILDFNKCYNPWCAYSEGYNCPVPPVSNHLPLMITAGEKKYRGKIKVK